MVCGFEGCVKIVSRKGWCEAHYTQQYRGETMRPIRMRTDHNGELCAFEGCERTTETKDWCRTHYTQVRQGRELAPIQRSVWEHGTLTGYIGHKCRCDQCSLATSEYNKAYRSENPEIAYKGKREKVEWLQEIKKASGCNECGYNAHPEALEFHHIDSSTKDFTVSKGASVGWDRLKAEVAKCEVLCSNCHHVRTATDRYSMITM